MVGVIIEAISNKKLIAFTVLGAVCQIVCFLIGGLTAPSPYNVQSLLATKCIDKNLMWNKFFEPWGSAACDSVNSLKDQRIYDEHIDSNNIVFSVRFPVRKGGEQLDMSRWQQNLVAVLQVEVDQDSGLSIADLSTMSADVHLGYRNKGEDNTTWHTLARSREIRELKCHLGLPQAGNPHAEPVYQCDMLPLFELGSCHHDYYLVNIRLPVLENITLNENLPMIEDVWMFVIHQNGGFTKVWLALKTFMLPMVLAALGFHVHRIRQLSRPFNLLEKMLITLGSSITLLNLPIEFFSLWVHMPYMLLFTDIRQGIFYTVLFAFWIIFAGEHLMDQVERNRLVVYWKHLSAVGFGCICLFVFEMCERGVQLTNPFYSIWSTKTGSNIALAFIILAGIAACVYFFFLLYMIICVFRNITAKKSSLPQMSKARKRFYMGLIYRFNFLMALTLICAAATVVFFIMGQVSEGHWKWEEDQTSMEYTSAVMTGVYGMWNIYVLSLLILYAPSTKNMTEANEASEDEVIEFVNMPSEASALTSLAQKANLD